MNFENSLNESEYSKLVEEMQDGHNVDRVKTKVGRKRGLRLTLDLHSNNVGFGTLNKDFNAFNVFIGVPEEFPVLRERGLKLQPGREHFLELSAQVVSSSGITEVLPQDRNCYFQNEGNLAFYKTYTFSNCILECHIKIAEYYIRCIPWYLPHGKDSLTCDPWTGRHFLKKLGNLTSDECDCLPNCQETVYAVTPFSAAFRLK